MGPEADSQDMGHLDVGEGQRKSVQIRALNNQQQTEVSGTPGKLGFTHLAFFTMKGTSEHCIEVVSKQSRSH